VPVIRHLLFDYNRQALCLAPIKPVIRLVRYLNILLAFGAKLLSL